MRHLLSAIGITLSVAAAAQGAPRPGLDERIQCQQAIEAVYARHRTSPQGTRAIPAAVIRRKAADPVLKSAALERFWGVTVTGDELQAELDRMAGRSQARDVLAELWTALGDDPRLAAECLARPALVDRRLRTYYAFDDRLHGRREERARSERRAADTIEALKGGTGVYSETEWRLARDSAQAHGSIVVDAGTFAARAREVRRALGVSEGAVAPGRPGALLEDETRFYVTAALAFDADRVRVATVEWRKEPFDAWWQRTRDTLPLTLDPPEFRFTKPEIAAAIPCVDDTWRPTLHLLDPRYWHSAVWTGSEMIVFGGMRSVGTYFDDGSRYDPATDTWALLPAAGAPSARQAHVAVWTGTDMIVWGSTNDRSGALYDPLTDSWRPMSVANAPVGRSDASVVWTGTEMIVWGGEMVNSGGRYNPATDTWALLPAAPLAARAYHSAVWTGTHMIIWGGYNAHIGQMYDDGARYHPATDSWSPVTPAGAPTMRYWHTAVWTGTEMIVWGGINYPVYDRSGGRYNPATDTWTPTSMVNAPSLRWMHMAVWTGTEMIVQGGTPDALTGGRYRPSTDTWTATSPVNAANNGQGITAVWTGTEMIVWGGLDDDFVFHNDGGRYNPATDSWLRTTTMNVPQARGLHAAVWTGAEMMIWGGNEGAAGGLYDPATDTWRTASTTGAPYARQNPTGVWTGQVAIFWGGGQSWVDPGTGGRYDPATDSWADVSVVNAPNDRYGHSAVWTGTEMIVFGGIGTLNDAKRYRPATDTWADSTTTNAPGERDHHAAVWTGTEMIIWGGFINNGITPTGGRYRPDTDTWTPTNVADSPVTRMWPVGVWTGTEMVVWGGYDWLWVGDLGDGARYRPADDTWTATTLVGAPSPRIPQGVWTGSEMLLWGGANDSSGARYNPVSDSWRPTTFTNAPDVRYGGRWSTVWTGTEMIIWGGIIETQEGGRYCAVVATDPDIYVTPGLVEFGTIIAGQSEDRTITVRNEGGADLTVSAVAPPSAPFSIVSNGCTGAVLPPSASCAITARFAPTAVGTWSGAIVISSDDPDEPQVTVGLAGTGAPVPVPDISVAPAALSFGTVVVGQAHDDLVSVINDGAAPLVIQGVTPPGAPFSVLGNQCTGATLPPGAGCLIFLRFAPTAPGAYSDSLVVASNDPDEPTAASLLSGTAVSMPLQPAALGVQDGGNGVWEPGETVTLVTSWTNTGAVLAPSVTGTFTPAPGVTLPDADADYGDIPAGATVSCSGGVDCANALATGPRPAAHWDAVLSETLSSGPTHDWTLHVGASFADVPTVSPFYRFVETVLHASVTGGCTAIRPAATSRNGTRSSPPCLPPRSRCGPAGSATS